MTVEVNGEVHSISPVATVVELVDALGLPRQAVLIEQNGCALLRDEWTVKAVSEGDCFEILRVVAGG